jgi:TolB-like protein
MGIHSGPVSGVTDVNDRSNIAGAGINTAQRVMDCGDAGHILLSKRAAEDLAQSRQWRPYLHDLGECAVKHGVPVFLVNFYSDGAGNPQLPEKLKKEQEERAAAAAVSRPPPTLRRKHVLIGASVLLVAAIATVFLLFSLQRGSRLGTSLVSLKSVAVLPFENFSADKENAFFADGIQDDILTSLARIRDLKVISRSSVMQVRDVAARNLREIGKTLGVANILEGSVRREGTRVVVNVQLIDALHGQHVWASHYDRTLANSLGLQGELAAEIADALRVTLSPDEKARVEKKPTLNPEAYLVYLQANQIERNPDTVLGDFK